MVSQEVEIVNKLGLHARAAAKLVTTAANFNADIALQFRGKKINGKSIMGVMMLAAGQGSKIELIADGADEHEALQSIIELINNKFGEKE